MRLLLIIIGLACAVLGCRGVTPGSDATFERTERTLSADGKTISESKVKFTYDTAWFDGSRVGELSIDPKTGLPIFKYESSLNSNNAKDAKLGELQMWSSLGQGLTLLLGQLGQNAAAAFSGRAPTAGATELLHKNP